MATRSDKTPLIVIVGETASGKTAAAIAIAKQTNGEIICADSRTIYKGMSIGTAKPTDIEQKEVHHHLIDLIEPNEAFSVAQFKVLAQKCIQEIIDRGKTPILVGGSGLYIDAVLYNFHFSNSADLGLRERLEQMNDEELTTILNTKNISSVGLNTKNRRHVIRAIERNGEIQKQHSIRENTLVVGIRTDREVLRKRITDRTQHMFDEGFIEEAKYLFQLYGNDIEAFRTPGYTAARSYLDNTLTLAQAKEAFIAADLKLAKRQRTWFKRNKHILWFDDPKSLVQQAVTFAKSTVESTIN